MKRAPFHNFVVTLLVVVAGVAGCSDNASLSWTEEVTLPDKRVITLERFVEFKGGASRPGDPATESLQRITFRHPDTGETVRWENTKEDGRLQTVALWLDQGTPLLLTDPAYGDAHIKYRCPNPPYLLYEYAHGKWSQRPLSQIGVDRLRANMTTRILEARSEIERGGHHLVAEQTANSYAYRDGKFRVPYVIEFKGMPEQTFVVYENCNRPLDLLLAR